MKIIIKFLVVALVIFNTTMDGMNTVEANELVNTIYKRRSLPQGLLLIDTNLFQTMNPESNGSCSHEHTSINLDGKKPELVDRLLNAVQNGNIKEINRLIQKGADPFKQSCNGEGVTPYGAALLYNAYKQNSAMPSKEAILAPFKEIFPEKCDEEEFVIGADDDDEF